MSSAVHEPLFHRVTGHGPPVAFLCGAPAPWDALAALVPSIATTHTCIEIAVPGTEPSGRTLPVSVEESNERVERTLRHLGIADCALVGFSSGAYRSFAIATRGVVRATHLLSIAGVAWISPEDRAAFLGFAELTRSGAAFGSLAADRFLSHAFAAAHPAVVRDVTRWLDDTPREIQAAELTALIHGPDLRPALGALAAPVVARVGTHDLAAPVFRSEEIVAACPIATLELVEGAGHALIYEDLAGTQASLRRLLTR
jgi:pimeloyl-ACP methyl ester carboxylesterase